MKLIERINKLIHNNLQELRSFDPVMKGNDIVGLDPNKIIKIMRKWDMNMGIEALDFPINKRLFPKHLNISKYNKFFMNRDKDENKKGTTFMYLFDMGLSDDVIYAVEVDLVENKIYSYEVDNRANIINEMEIDTYLELENEDDFCDQIKDEFKIKWRKEGL